MNAIAQFLSGGVTIGCLAIGFFFYQFWKATRDKFFAAFAAAFWLLAVERIVLIATAPMHEWEPYVYLIRFAAFLMILGAIISKNLKGSG
jgi:hypothetical protein